MVRLTVTGSNVYIIASNYTGIVLVSMSIVQHSYIHGSAYTAYLNYAVNRCKLYHTEVNPM